MNRYKVVNGDYVALIDKILKQNLNNLLYSNDISKNDSSAVPKDDGRCEVAYSENRTKPAADKRKAKIQNNCAVLSKTDKGTAPKKIKKEETKAKNRGFYVFLGLMLFFVMIFLDIFSEYVFLLFFIAIIYFSIRRRAKQQKE